MSPLQPFDFLADDLARLVFSRCDQDCRHDGSVMCGCDRTAPARPSWHPTSAALPYRRRRHPAPRPFGRAQVLPLVCRRFAQLLRGPSLCWRKLRFSQFPPDHSPAVEARWQAQLLHFLTWALPRASSIVDLYLESYVVPGARLAANTTCWMQPSVHLSLRCQALCSLFADGATLATLTRLLNLCTALQVMELWLSEDMVPCVLPPAVAYPQLRSLTIMSDGALPGGLRCWTECALHHELAAEALPPCNLGTSAAAAMSPASAPLSPSHSNDPPMLSDVLNLAHLSKLQVLLLHSHAPPAEATISKPELLPLGCAWMGLAWLHRTVVWHCTALDGGTCGAWPNLAAIHNQ